MIHCHFDSVHDGGVCTSRRRLAIPERRRHHRRCAASAESSQARKRCFGKIEQLYSRVLEEVDAEAGEVSVVVEPPAAPTEATQPALKAGEAFGRSMREGHKTRFPVGGQSSSDQFGLIPSS